MLNLFPVVALLAASAASAAPGKMTNFLRRSDDHFTKEQYDKILPAECKDVCNKSAYGNDEFWAKRCPDEPFGKGECKDLACKDTNALKECYICDVQHTVGKQNPKFNVEDFKKSIEAEFKLAQSWCHSEKPTARAEYDATIPGPCKEKCKESFWGLDAWWAPENNCPENLSSNDACAKLLCGRIDQAIECERCTVYESKDSISDFKPEDFEKKVKEDTKTIRDSCEAAGIKVEDAKKAVEQGKRAFHHLLMTREEKQEGAEYTKEDLRKTIPEECHATCEDNLLSQKYFDVCNDAFNAGPACEKYTCEVYTKLINCSDCTTRSLVKDHPEYDLNEFEKHHDEYVKEGIEWCKASGYTAN